MVVFPRFRHTAALLASQGEPVLKCSQHTTHRTAMVLDFEVGETCQGEMVLLLRRIQFSLAALVAREARDLPPS